jgi:hypothetical protein
MVLASVQPAWGKMWQGFREMVPLHIALALE